MLFIILSRPFPEDKREEKGENVDMMQPADGTNYIKDKSIGKYLRESS